jgi:hypothetical protein
MVMNGYDLKLCMELVKWRDDEISIGNMIKAKKIQNIIRKKKIYNSNFSN